jgi:uncharacterized membrane protein YcfT
MTTNMTTNSSPRILWIDYFRGICIIFVLGWHSTLGVEFAAGQQSWLHPVVAFATPFRMPDFFLISGLFLARVLDRDWASYLDRRVLHFAYFYLLWMTIQIGVKAPSFASEFGWVGVAKLYALSIIDPFGALWFIYLLPAFFLVTKLVRPVPSPMIWLAAAGLEIADINTGWTFIDEFAQRFVYFYSGYLGATYVFALAARVQGHSLLALLGLAIWGVGNGYAVAVGWSTLPLVSLTLGFLGAAAMVSVAVLMANSGLFAPVRYLGEKSLYIYLAFFLPMATTRAVLLKTGLVNDVGIVALIVTVAAITGALVIYWMAQYTRLLGFLFERPHWAHLHPRRQVRLQPAG